LHPDNFRRDAGAAVERSGLGCDGKNSQKDAQENKNSLNSCLPKGLGCDGENKEEKLKRNRRFSEANSKQLELMPAERLCFDS